ncbi:hypothetical protein [Actinopolymorpha pittospori]|uniref:Uncharacterized protein n=1 Tax=Actinopolymorpha pittospori TaxID=648752 RepID=A0A927MXC3_9ACTN|nr:hypothetical protein [Actinopolymorpha pittospori]MBE1608660.1 hypothetical protein [Actinopolymorpha pittospori]
MALLLGSALVGKRLDMRALGKEVMGRLAESPEVGRIVGDVRGELLSTGRAAAMSALSRPLEGLADRLEERTAGLTGAASKRRPEEEEGEYEGRGADDEEEEPKRGRGQVEDDEEEEEEEAPRRRRASGQDEGDGSERRRSRNAAPPRQRDQEKESRTPPRTGRRGVAMDGSDTYSTGANSTGGVT